MILIISPSKKLARAVADTFHYMSILSYGATPAEALSEVSGIYSAALILHPESFPDIKDYLCRIKSYKSDLPIFAITEADYASNYIGLFEEIYTKTTMTPALATKIIEHANTYHHAKIGNYKLGGFDASCNNVGVNYFSSPINLTKTEAMILRYLSVSYPIPQKAEMIIKYAFKSNRAPAPSSVRTHISFMNKKISQTIGRKMIEYVPAQGYIILTPEYIHNLKNQ